jgi:hypothetical protein
LIATALRYFSEELGLKVKSISKVGQSPNYATAFLLDNGDIYTVGSNFGGFTGLGLTTGTTTKPTKLSLTNVKTFVSTESVFTALTNDGQLYQWGKGTDFNNISLGLFLDTSPSTKSTPRLVARTIPSPIVEIVSGGGRFFIICEDGYSYGWGSRRYYEIGDGYSSTAPINDFKQSLISNVKTVVSAANESIFITNDNKAYGCGFNNFGQLGLGHTNTVTTPTPITNDVIDVTSTGIGFAFLKNDKLYVTGNRVAYGSTGNYLTPTLFYTAKNGSIKLLKYKNYSIGLTPGLMLIDGSELYIIGNTYYKNNRYYTGLPSTSVTLGLSCKVTEMPVENFISDNEGNFIFTPSGSTFIVGKNTNYQLGLEHNNIQESYAQLTI